jgi:hypothetical protein
MPIRDAWAENRLGIRTIWIIEAANRHKFDSLSEHVLEINGGSTVFLPDATALIDALERVTISPCAQG